MVAGAGRATARTEWNLADFHPTEAGLARRCSGGEVPRARSSRHAPRIGAGALRGARALPPPILDVPRGLVGHLATVQPLHHVESHERRALSSERRDSTPGASRVREKTSNGPARSSTSTSSDAKIPTVQRSMCTSGQRSAPSRGACRAALVIPAVPLPEYRLLRGARSTQPVRRAPLSRPCRRSLTPAI
jgi:hypothetical protein